MGGPTESVQYLGYAPEPGSYSFYSTQTMELIDQDEDVLGVSSTGLYPRVQAAAAGPVILADGNGYSAGFSLIGDRVAHFLTPAPFEFRYSAYSNGNESLEIAPGPADVARCNACRVTRIVYTYTPVPEPSTALLVGIGLAVIGTGRARRNS
jgi:hypothetical protein